MSEMFPELDQTRVSVDRATRDRHLASIHSALTAAPRSRFRSRRFLLVAVAMALLLPVLTLAARDTVPGDVLYPVKVMLDPVSGALGGTSGAEARVDEVQRMIERRSAIDAIRDHTELAARRVAEADRAIEERMLLLDRLRHATEEVRGLEDVRARIDQIGDDLESRPDDSGSPAPDAPATTSTTTTRDERSETTTTTVSRGDGRP